MCSHPKGISTITPSFIYLFIFLQQAAWNRSPCFHSFLLWSKSFNRWGPQRPLHRVLLSVSLLTLTFLFFKSWLWREATDKLNSKSKYYVNHQKRHIYVEKYQNLNVRSLALILHQGYSKWGPGTSAHLRQDKNRKCKFENFRAVDITTLPNLWFCILQNSVHGICNLKNFHFSIISYRYIDLA